MNSLSPSLPSESSLFGSPLFDSHCHFDFDEFGGELEHAKLWAACQEKGIKHLLIPGVSPEQWPSAFKLAQVLSGVMMSVGVHPWWVKNIKGERLSTDQMTQLEHYLSQSDCVAVGECGLDANIELSVTRQQVIFEQQVQLACQMEKPLIIHVHKTHNQILKLLSHYRPSAGGVIHGFTGSVELAKQYWSLGFYIGIGGSITYPRANKTRQAVQTMPLESILLETDAPDMPLKGYQGQPNSPLRLLEVAKALAALRHSSVAEICQATTRNSCRLFKL